MTYFTHSGLFHCDEVTGYAICRIAGVSNSIIRLTDITELPDSDYAIIADIGRKYDPEKNRYDHHQDFLTRPNNYPYASAGLLWKQYGMQAIEATVGPAYADLIHRRVDERLIQGIDAHDADSLYEVSASCYIGEVNILTLPNVISAYNAQNLHDNRLQQAQFLRACNIVEIVLKAEIFNAQKHYEAAEKFASVAEVIEVTPREPVNLHHLGNAEIIILREPMPWKEIVHERHPRAVYVICPSAHPGNPWSLQAVPVDPKSRTIKKQIERPEWFTGFIHQGKWIAGGETVEILLELAKANLI